VVGDWTAEAAASTVNAMSLAGRDHVDQLTPENWSESKRTRIMGRISMSAWLEDAGDGRYRGVYGDPNGFGTEVFFDSLEGLLPGRTRTGALPS
jgi:hypothetical protein